MMKLLFWLLPIASDLLQVIHFNGIKNETKRVDKLFLSFIIFTAHYFLCNSDNAVNENAPNIILIMADDWSYPHAGFYGDSSVKTPTMDRLAKEGITFEQAFVSALRTFKGCNTFRPAFLEIRTRS